VAISTSANSVAERVLRLVGHPEVVEEPWFATGRQRADHSDELDTYVGDWIGQRTREEVVSAFASAGAAVAPVYKPSELLVDPQVRALELVTSVPDEDLGPIRMQNVMWRMDRTPGRIRSTGRALGADTESVLEKDLGLDADRIAELRERGVIR
jgi:crotonobetainyl-CoA:carnitine CoA-transferase CaiB-like acyl-CoA transferase